MFRLRSPSTDGSVEGKGDGAPPVTASSASSEEFQDAPQEQEDSMMMNRVVTLGPSVQDKSPPPPECAPVLLPPPGAEAEKPPPPPKNSCDDPETLQRLKLAAAWMAKRHGKPPVVSNAKSLGGTFSLDGGGDSSGESDDDDGSVSVKSLGGGGYMSSGPIDVDAAMDEAIENGEDFDSDNDSMSYLGDVDTGSTYALSNDPIFQVRLNHQKEADRASVASGHTEHDRASVISAATSERTLPTSNRLNRLSQSLSSKATESLKIAPEEGAPEVINKTYGGGGTGGLDSVDGEVTPEEEKQQFVLEDMCNPRTYAGKVTCLLSVILILAVLIIVVSLVLPGSGDDEQSSAAASEIAANSTRGGGGQTLRPSMIRRGEPTLAPVTAEPTKPKPTGAPSLEPTPTPTISPTSAPTVSFANMAFTPLPELAGNAKGDSFGSSVALSANGRVLVLGARGAGRVQIYRIDSAAASTQREVQPQQVQQEWIELGSSPLTGRNLKDAFGSNVAINRNGSIVVVAEPARDNEQTGDNAGSVRAFRLNEQGSYVRLGQTLEGPTVAAYFGSSLSLSASGRRMAIGAPYYSATDSEGLSDFVGMEGQVRVVELKDDNSEWLDMMGSPLDGEPTDWFGSDVALSPDGRLLAASAPRNADYEGLVRAWKLNDEQEWTQLDTAMMVNTFFPPASTADRFGHVLSVSTGLGGADGVTSVYRVAIGVPNKAVSKFDACGVVIVYELDPETEQWYILGRQPIALSASEAMGEAHFGYSLRLDGNFLVVGAPGYNARAGAVFFYGYDRFSDSWVQNRDATVLGKAVGDDFGFSVSSAHPEANGFLIAASAIAADEGTGHVQSFVQQVVER